MEKKVRNKEEIYTDDNERFETNKKIWMCIISIFCIMVGVMYIQKAITSSILILLAGILVLPPVDELIKENLKEINKIKLFSILRSIYIVVAVMIMIMNIPEKAVNQNTIKETITNIIDTGNGKYNGEIIDGKMHGKGTYEWNDGTKYVGEFFNDKISGQGTLTMPGKGYYEGKFRSGKKNGQGTYKFENGDIYEGNWSDDKMSGKGTYTFCNGEKYVGEFKDNQFNGRGTYFKDGKSYTGTWQDNQYKK